MASSFSSRFSSAVARVFLLSALLCAEPKGAAVKPRSCGVVLQAIEDTGAVMKTDLALFVDISF